MNALFSDSFCASPQDVSDPSTPEFFSLSFACVREGPSHMHTSALTRALHSAPSESMSSTLTICAGMFGAFVRALLCNSSISAEIMGYRMTSARPVASWRNITPATPKGTRSAASATTSCTAEVLRAQGGLGGAFARFARSVYRVKPRFYAECVRGERVCAEARM